ncbi:hypothetical protein JCM10213_000725 [Rhodosporidiobolus nylandii]
MSSLNAQRPSTLEAALERIAVLEAQLDKAREVVRERTGENLEDWIEQADRRRTATTQGMGDSSSLAAAPGASGAVKQQASEESTTEGQEAEEQEEQPFDLGPLVLRALQLRKDLHSGAVPEERGEEELEKILAEGEGRMDEGQRGTVRMWAGL